MVETGVKWSKETSLKHVGGDNVGADFGRAHASANMGVGTGVKAGVDAGYDVAAGKVGPLSAAVGPNVKTGAEVSSEGVSANLLGFGFSVGRNTGISTPLGRINLKLW